MNKLDGDKLDWILDRHEGLRKHPKKYAIEAYKTTKQAILKLMMEMVPERKKSLEDNKMTQWTRDGFNLCRDVILDNLKKLETR